MATKDNSDMKPLLLKFGVALVISVAGFLYTQLRTRRIRPSLPPLPSPPPPPPPPPSHRSPSSDDANKFDNDGRTDLKDDLRSIKAPLCSCDDASCTPYVSEVSSHQEFTNDGNLVELSPSRKYSGEEEELKLPKFKDFVLKEFELTSDTAMASKVAAETEETEQEIINLRNMVKVLQEREKNLEIQLLEYYGLKEQEITMAELQNRLKINNMEAKLYTLKIESLQGEKQRLEAQVADHERVVAELETARATIMKLRKKLRSDEEKKRELFSALKQSVAKLQEQEQMAMLNDADVQNKLQRLKELEDESAELKRAISSLQQENSALARRLESTQILASSILEDSESEALREANNRLRQENEELMKEIERLRVDGCADVEELVYLRWVNACLRYELRNYQPGPDKSVARDLSMTLSPKSEEKAKQLILEYANSEGLGDKDAHIVDFDYDHCSSPQASDLTDSPESDDIYGDVSATTRTHRSSKTKFFRRLKNLVLGKDSHKRTLSVDTKNTSFAGSGRNESVSTTSFEDMMGTYSCDTLSSNHNSSAMATPLTAIGARTTGQSTQITLRQGSLRPSLDIQRIRNQQLEDMRDGESIRIRSSSDVGSSVGYKRMVLGENSIIGLPLDNQLDQDDPDARKKLELKNFAEVLKGSRGTIPKFS